MAPRRCRRPSPGARRRSRPRPGFRLRPMLLLLRRALLLRGWRGRRGLHPAPPSSCRLRRRLRSALHASRAALAPGSCAPKAAAAGARRRARPPPAQGGPDRGALPAAVQRRWEVRTSLCRRCDLHHIRCSRKARAPPRSRVGGPCCQPGGAPGAFHRAGWRSSGSVGGGGPRGWRRAHGAAAPGLAGRGTATLHALRDPPFMRRRFGRRHDLAGASAALPARQHRRRKFYGTAAAQPWSSP
jgi:hypothetical protein